MSAGLIGKNDLASLLPLDTERGAALGEGQRCAARDRDLAQLRVVQIVANGVRRDKSQPLPVGREGQVQRIHLATTYRLWIEIAQVAEVDLLVGDVGDPGSIGRDRDDPAADP